MVLAGVGPLLLVVASQLSEAGVNVVAVSEPVSPWASLSLLPALVRERSLLADGFRYRGGLLRRRVPWLSRTILTRIEGTEQVRAAVVMRADRDWRPVAGTERRFEVDAVAMGYGLLPSLELPRICGCAVEYDRDRRGWRPTRTEHFESSVPGVFVVGDGAGVAGAVVAVEEGRIAGLAAAHQLGKLSAQETADRTAAHAERLRRLDLFRRAVDQAFALQDGLFEIDDAATIACRCEEVSFAELVAALDDGADTPAMLKSFTRCGMGPCQGRMCAASTTEWLASRTGQSIEALGLAPAAPPAKPVTTLETLAAS
jgi:NADPH-dependent 2,4-dienoyl-CoA reductase/sulfur reductase-like enzyme